MSNKYVCADGFKTDSYEKFVEHLMFEEARGLFDKYPNKMIDWANQFEAVNAIEPPVEEDY